MPGVHTVFDKPCVGSKRMRHLAYKKWSFVGVREEVEINRKTAAIIPGSTAAATQTAHCQRRCKIPHYRRDKFPHLTTFMHVLEGCGNANDGGILNDPHLYNQGLNIRSKDPTQIPLCPDTALTATENRQIKQTRSVQGLHSAAHPRLPPERRPDLPRDPGDGI